MADSIHFNTRRKQELTFRQNNFHQENTLINDSDNEERNV